MNSVAERTQERGSLATDPSLSWLNPGSKDGRRLWGTLGASVFVHALLSPLPALLGLVAMLGAYQPEDVDEPPLDAIPVDLLEEGDLEPPAPEPPAAPPPSEAGAAAPPPEPEKSPESPAPPAEKPAQKTPAEAPPADKPQAEQTGAGAGRPTSFAGLAGQAMDSNAAVQIFLNAAEIRSHALGPRVGSLLQRTPQWNDFFGTTGIDPIRDVDRMLIAGPQLRNSSNVAALVQHRLPAAIVEGAFERLVARGGEWIEHTDKKKLARAQADRAERIFVAPSPNLVAVVPKSAEKSARALSAKAHVKKGPPGVALSAYVVDPWHVTRGIPKSLKWARVELRPSEGGGATILIEAEDESAEAAAANAPALERQIRSLSEDVLGRFIGALGKGGDALGSVLGFLGAGGKKTKVIESISFAARGEKIEGKLVLTAAQLEDIVNVIDAFLPEARPPAREEPGSTQKDPSPNSTAPSGSQSGAEGSGSPREDSATPEPAPSSPTSPGAAPLAPPSDRGADPPADAPPPAE